MISGVLNLSSSYLARDYRRTSGTIENVDRVKVLTDNGYSIKYNYEIHWESDGREYCKKLYRETSVPSKTVLDVWVNSENTNALTSSPSEIRKESYLGFGLGFALLIVGNCLFKREKRRAKKYK